MFFFRSLYIYGHRLVKYSIKYFASLQYSFLYFSNRLSSSIQKDINLLRWFLSPSLTLNVLAYPIILGNIKPNGLITSYKYPTKCLKLLFISVEFESTILLIYQYSKVALAFLHHKVLLFLLSSHQISILLYYQTNAFSRGKEPHGPTLIFT